MSIGSSLEEPLVGVIMDKTALFDDRSGESGVLFQLATQKREC